MTTRLTRFNSSLPIYECDCEKCRLMCQHPCCGTPEDMKLIIENGFAKRLMFDDLPDGDPLLKPALKGCEGKTAPWETGSVRGCTFWKNGKCELHESGLKPSQGKMVIHSMSDDQYMEIADFIEESWQTDKALEVIQLWKNEVGYDKPID